VSGFGFLSLDASAPRTSPLARAFAGHAAPGVRDVSGLGVFELHCDPSGAAAADAGEELVRATPTRAFLVTEAAAEAVHGRFTSAELRVYDVTAGFAALEVDGERIMRRLTDLDLDALPAVGPVGRGVAAIVQRPGAETFRILVPQELGHYVAEVALDVAGGLP
jgi:hypothetical protein